MMLKDKKVIEWVGIPCVALLVLLLMAIPGFAQLPTGTILGVVKDSSGAVVPGANVTITNTDTSLARTGTSAEDGSYRFPALPVGHYRVEVTKEGFSALTRTGITLEVAQEATIDLILEVGSPAQSVTVAEEVPLVQTSSSTVGGLVNEQQVSDLPLNGRNLVTLTLLQAGITQTTVIPATTIGSALTTGVTISNNGMPIHSNSYMLDGANTVGFFGLNNSSIIGTTMGVDGVKEYKVVTNTPSAEYGLSMGSQTTIVSKGGTNRFHGDAFDYLRNDALDARNYFDALDKLNFNGFGMNKSLDYPGKRIPPFHRNNFGASFGGPIKKDKTFFYAVYDNQPADLGLLRAAQCPESVINLVMRCLAKAPEDRPQSASEIELELKNLLVSIGHNDGPESNTTRLLPTSPAFRKPRWIWIAGVAALLLLSIATWMAMHSQLGRSERAFQPFPPSKQSESGGSVANERKPAGSTGRDRRLSDQKIMPRRGEQPQSGPYHDEPHANSPFP